MRASAHLRAWSTLPQRIRAGCDSGLLSNCRADIGFASAHSRGLRRCDLFPRRTVGRSLPQRIRAGCDGCLLCVLSVLCYLCHSAFARVATYAVAILAAAVGDFATAHSRGLRLGGTLCLHSWQSLPQRIRAGCDCGKAMQRTANLLREGR